MSQRWTVIHWFTGFRWTIKNLNKIGELKLGEPKDLFLVHLILVHGYFDIKILIYHKKSLWTKIRWTSFRLIFFPIFFTQRLNTFQSKSNIIKALFEIKLLIKLLVFLTINLTWKIMANLFFHSLLNENIHLS